jgi:hypothetical protein
MNLFETASKIPVKIQSKGKRQKAKGVKKEGLRLTPTCHRFRGEAAQGLSKLRSCEIA